MDFVNVLCVILLFAAVEQVQCKAYEQGMWPDLSCSKEYAGSELERGLEEEYARCNLYATPGPNDPYGELNNGVCVKLCMLVNSGLAHMNSATDQFYITPSAWKTWSFNTTAHWKVLRQCGELFERIFYVEKERCNSARAHAFYHCVQNVLCETEEESEWPNLSCRDYYVESDIDRKVSDIYRSCSYSATPGPNDNDLDEDGGWGFCVRFCVLVNSGLAYKNLDTNKFQITRWARKDNEIFDDATRKKVHEQCADLFETVFYVEKEKCNSARAQEVYSCVKKMLC